MLSLKRTNFFSKFLKNQHFSFSKVLDLPIIDVNKYLNRVEGWEKECKIVSDCLYETGVLCIKDPRVNEKDNQIFISQMEEYFYKVSKDYYKGIISSDFHPEAAYQYGPTPEFKEKAKSHCDRFKNYPNENKPITECPPVYDSKWRFFWFIGERKKEFDEGMLMYENLIPEGFPNWKTVMDNWGNHMLKGTEVVSEMVAHGLGLPENIFTEKMKYAGHLLAPTGSDLSKFKTNDIFAGVHYDLNYLTIHGKSNYGGLYIWLRNGNKSKVKIPDGCLLLQCGRQMEYLTGGTLMAGFHEVIYTDEVKAIVDEKLKENEKLKFDKNKLWRVSSTLFSQIRQNVVLEPIGKYKTNETIKKYPPILTRDQVAEELKAIKLMI